MNNILRKNKITNYMINTNEHIITFRVNDVSVKLCPMYDLINDFSANKPTGYKIMVMDRNEWNFICEFHTFTNEYKDEWATDYYFKRKEDLLKINDKFRLAIIVGEIIEISGTIIEEDVNEIITKVINTKCENCDDKYIELEQSLLETCYHCVIDFRYLSKYSENLDGAIELIKDLITPIARKNDLLGSFYYMKKIENIEDNFTKAYEEFYSKMNGRDMDYEIYNIICTNVFDKWKIYRKNKENNNE